MNIVITLFFIAAGLYILGAILRLLFILLVLFASERRKRKPDAWSVRFVTWCFEMGDKIGL